MLIVAYLQCFLHLLTETQWLARCKEADGFITASSVKCRVAGPLDEESISGYVSEETTQGDTNDVRRWLCCSGQFRDFEMERNGVEVERREPFANRARDGFVTHALAIRVPVTRRSLQSRSRHNTQTSSIDFSRRSHNFGISNCGRTCSCKSKGQSRTPPWPFSTNWRSLRCRKMAHSCSH